MNETFSYNLKKVEEEKEQQVQKQRVFHPASQSAAGQENRKSAINGQDILC